MSHPMTRWTLHSEKKSPGSIPYEPPTPNCSPTNTKKDCARVCTSAAPTKPSWRCYPPGCFQTGTRFLSHASVSARVRVGAFPHPKTVYGPSLSVLLVTCTGTVITKYSTSALFGPITLTVCSYTLRSTPTLETRGTDPFLLQSQALPCRHMCMCGACARMLRGQSNRCPICRTPVESLLEIKVATKQGE